ncbi:MAG: SPOR domain-containing protein [Gammaproteobacteria bacterium]|nr:SPOR domain-containing protein [Gammaproteobacteria bacterium]
MQETTRLLIHTPASWQRLVSVIRHQAAPGHFIFIEGPHASGKSTFAQILQKKLTLVDDVEAKYLKLHPLMGIQQILSEVPEQSDVLPIIILDDANEVEAAVIEELISSNVNCFLVVLAEPELIDRVPRLQNSRFNLPLFNKEDCHKLLSKMYHAIDPSIDIPTLESELVYYESKGFPGKVIELGEKLNAKLKRNTSGNLGFDLANKGIFSTLVIGLGLVIFLLYLFLSDSKQPDKELIQEEQELTELPIQAENKAEEMISGELIITEPEVIKPATFETWLLQQDPDDFTIQLFSNVAKQQAESFQKELDLADSYVYSAEIDGQMLYRVVWGVYPNRARAQLAIQSLPEKILKQKPWLRSFSAISKEIAVQP